MTTLDNLQLPNFRKYYEKPEDGFLELIAPEIEEILEIVAEEATLLPLVVEYSSLLQSVYEDLKYIWYPRLQRCCVLELESLRQKGKLDQTKDSILEFTHLLKLPQHRDFILKKYPVLKEKVIQFPKIYCKNLRRFFDALKTDFHHLTELFFRNQIPHKLQYLYFTGDPHSFYNRVILMEFRTEAGIERLIYKPRSIENEFAFNEFVGELNDFLPIPLKQMTCLNKENYGFCEYIQRMPCANETEIENYYFRYGALVAIAYFLEISDIHYENLIASGEYPVLVDLECLGRPLLAHPSAPNSPFFFQKSILNSGLLPQYEFAGDGCLDVSAISGGQNQETPFLISELEKDQNENYRVVQKKATLYEQENTPQLQDQKIHPQEYTDQIADGFKSAFSVIIANQKTIIKISLPKFAKCRSRIIFRSTHIYLTLLKEQYHPVHLFDPKKWEEHLLWVQANVLKEFDPSGSEFQQMIHDDVPIFQVKLGETVIEDGYKTSLEIQIYRTGYDVLESNFKTASYQDLDIQLDYLRYSLVCLDFNENKDKSLILKKQVKERFPQTAGLSELEKISIILNHQKDTHQHVDGYFSFWPIHKHKEINGRVYQYLSTTGIDLYEGIIGILLPFLYAAKLLNTDSFKSFCTKNLAGIQKILESQLHLETIDLGIFSGLGGVGYLCFVLYNLGEEKWACSLEKAFLKLARKMLHSWLNQVEFSFDIISGFAGFIVALHLLNQYDLDGTKQISEMLNTCNTFFFQRYPIPSQLPKQTAHINERPILGMSHGVSGIAWALSRVFDNGKSSQWIMEALDYERKYFSKEHQNWPNFLKSSKGKPQKENYQPDWCHGAIGIGFVRMDLYQKGWRDSLIESEIQVAISCALNTLARDNVNLCHGLLGNHDFILHAYKNGWVNTKTYQRVCGILEQKVDQLNQVSTETSLLLYNPGLMTGYAGIAYQLLRKLDPERIPSVLTLR